MTDEKRKKEGFFGEQGRRTFLQRLGGIMASLEIEGATLKEISEFVIHENAHPIATSVKDAAKKAYGVLAGDIFTSQLELPFIEVEEELEGDKFSSLEEGLTRLHEKAQQLEEALEAIHQDYANDGPTKTLLRKETEEYLELIKRANTLVAKNADEELKRKVNGIAEMSTIHPDDDISATDPHMHNMLVKMLEKTLEPHTELYDNYTRMKQRLKRETSSKLEPIYKQHGIDRKALRTIALAEFENFGGFDPMSTIARIQGQHDFTREYTTNRVQWVVGAVREKAKNLGLAAAQTEQLEVKLGQIEEGWKEKLTSTQQKPAEKEAEQPAEQEPAGKHAQRILDERALPWPWRGNDVY